MSAETASIPPDPSETALREQIGQEITARETALLASDAPANFWEEASARQALAAQGAVQREIWNDSQGEMSVPVKKVYNAIEADLLDETVDTSPARIVEELLEQGHVPRDAATANGLVSVLADHGRYKLGKWGSARQLEQVLRVMDAYADQVPGFDPQRAGLREIREDLIAGVAALRADSKTKPHLVSAYPERQRLDAAVDDMLGQVAKIEAKGRQVRDDERLVTAEEVGDYLDYLEQDDLQYWQGPERQQRSMMITALRRELQEAGPDADPRQVIAGRIAQLERLSARKPEVAAQLEQLQGLAAYIGTPEGNSFMRMNLELWHERSGNDREHTPTVQSSDKTTTTHHEAYGGMSEADIAAARRTIGGMVLKRSNVETPRQLPAADAATAEEAPKTDERLGKFVDTDFETLNYDERLAAARELVAGIGEKYGIAAQTPQERQAYVDQAGTVFTGDIHQKAEDIRARALTAQEREMITKAKSALGSFIREGDSDARSLSRELSSLDRFGSYVTDDPAQLRQLLTQVGFREEQVAKYESQLRERQRRVGADEKAVLMVTFARKSSAPDPRQGEIDDEPMVWLTSTRR